MTSLSLSRVTDEAAEHHQCMMSGSCLEAESDEHPVDDLPMSRSSTVAGKFLGSLQN